MQGVYELPEDENENKRQTWSEYCREIWNTSPFDYYNLITHASNYANNYGTWTIKGRI